MLQSYSHSRQANGFTLAELLISLAILACITMFAITKVIWSQENSKRAAIFKECISIVSSNLNTGLSTGGITTSPSPLYTNNAGTYILNHINALKVCNTNASTQGCWTQPYGLSEGVENTEPGLVMHNGATIAGLDNPGNDSNAVAIDWNGTDGPNVEGQDQLLINYCNGPTLCHYYAEAYSAGRIHPSNASTTLYTTIFSQ